MINVWKKIVLLILLSATLNMSPQIIYFSSRSRIRSRELVSLENDKITMELITINEDKRFAELISISMFVRVQDIKYSN